MTQYILKPTLMSEGPNKNIILSDKCSFQMTTNVLSRGDADCR